MSLSSPTHKEKVGVLQTDSNHTWDPGGEKVTPNHYISVIISSPIIASESDNIDINVEEERLRTDVDPHANMVVVC